MLSDVVTNIDHSNAISPPLEMCVCVCVFGCTASSLLRDLSQVAMSRGYSLAVMHQLLLVAERGLWGAWTLVVKV